jgi:hypothetical protein
MQPMVQGSIQSSYRASATCRVRLLDLAAEDGGEIGQLIAFWKQDQDRPVEFASMEAWLKALVASMEDGTLVLA